MTTVARARPLFDPPLVKVAIKDSFIKLAPWVQWRNPVMFVVLIVNPDKLILAEYKLRQSAWELERKKLKRLRNARANTLDGTVIELHANIEKPEDIVEVKENAATCIGLFRSEFLFLNRDNLPDEEIGRAS